VVPKFAPVNGFDGSENRAEKSAVVSGLRQLRDYLGPESFDSVLYCLLVGHQVVVRGQPSSMVTSTLQVLQVTHNTFERLYFLLKLHLWPQSGVIPERDSEALSVT